MVSDEWPWRKEDSTSLKNKYGKEAIINVEWLCIFGSGMGGADDNEAQLIVDASRGNDGNEDG